MVFIKLMNSRIFVSPRIVFSVPYLPTLLGHKVSLARQEGQKRLMETSLNFAYTFLILAASKAFKNSMKCKVQNLTQIEHFWDNKNGNRLSLVIIFLSCLFLALFLQYASFNVIALNIFVLSLADPL